MFLVVRWFASASWLLQLLFLLNHAEGAAHPRRRNNNSYHANNRQYNNQYKGRGSSAGGGGSRPRSRFESSSQIMMPPDDRFEYAEDDNEPTTTYFERNNLTPPPLISRIHKRPSSSQQQKQQRDLHNNYATNYETNNPELDEIIITAKYGEDGNAMLRHELLWGHDGDFDKFYYDKHSYPWEYVWYNNTGKQEGVPVEMNINFHRVFSVDIVNSVIDLVVWLRLQWVDPRLTWIPEEYGGLNTSWFWLGDGGNGGETSEIWTPDLELWNLDVGLKGSFEDAYARVSNDGLVYWSRPGHLRPTCKFAGLDSFPFDKLVCAMEFGSWMHSGKYIRVETLGDGFFVGGSKTAGASYAEYTLAETDPVTVEKYVYPPFIGSPSESWPVLLYNVTIARSWQPYARGYIATQIVLNFIGFSAFWLPPSCGERMCLSITAMLAALAAEIVIAANLPMASEMTWYTKFTILSLSFAFISLMQSVLVLYFYYSKSEDLVPVWYSFTKNWYLVRQAKKQGGIIKDRSAQIVNNTTEFVTETTNNALETSSELLAKTTEMTHKTIESTNNALHLTTESLATCAKDVKRTMHLPIVNESDTGEDDNGSCSDPAEGSLHSNSSDAGFGDFLDFCKADSEGQLSTANSTINGSTSNPIGGSHDDLDRSQKDASRTSPRVRFLDTTPSSRSGVGSKDSIRQYMRSSISSVGDNDPARQFRRQSMVNSVTSSTIIPRDADDFYNDEELENNMKWKMVASRIDDVARFWIPLAYVISLSIIVAQVD